MDQTLPTDSDTTPATSPAERFLFTQQSVQALLESVAAGKTSTAVALEQLRSLPFENLDCATIDHHRELRTGLAEVIFCSGKTTEQVAQIAARLAERTPRLLGTRATRQQFEAARALVPDLQFHESARVFWRDSSGQPKAPGVVIVSAGTSDLPVAEEAAVTLEVFGHQPHRITDVGVAGLHRLLPRVGELRRANVVIAVAGMEGALPSVIAGLIPTPLIAVPTSVGYGTHFGGLTALLAMLNSCAAGLSVVNIDNGFGAACMAAAINNKCLAAANASNPKDPP